MGSVEPGGFYEIRLDLLKPSELVNPNIDEVFRTGARLIATFRPLPDGSGAAAETTRLAVLQRAVGAGAAYVDIELDAPTAHRAAILATAKAHGCPVIISYHDFEGTPARDAMIDIIERSKAGGGDLVKIACQVNSPDDCARLLGLLDGRPDLVVTGMGPLGRIVRLAAPLLGSPFTYAAPDDGPLTAPGQIRAGELEQIIQQIDSLSS